MKPIVYLYFHSKIREWKGKEMNEKEFRSCFFQWRIPKSLRHQIVKEMQKMGLIETRKKIIILKDFYFEVPPKNGMKREHESYVPYKKLKID